MAEKQPQKLLAKTICSYYIVLLVVLFHAQWGTSYMKTPDESYQTYYRPSPLKENSTPPPSFGPKFSDAELKSNSNRESKFSDSESAITSNRDSKFPESELTNNKNDDSKFSVSESAIRHRESKFPDSELAINRNRESKFPDSESAIRHREFKFPDSELTINRNRESKFSNSESAIRHRESKFHDSELTINRNRESKFPDPESAIRHREFKYPDSELTSNRNRESKFPDSELTKNKNREPKFFDSDLAGNRQNENNYRDSKADTSNWGSTSSQKNEKYQNARGRDHPDLQSSSDDELPSYGTSKGHRRPSNNKATRSSEDAINSEEVREGRREKTNSFSDFEDSLSRDTERNSRGIPAIPGSFGPEPYFSSDDGDDNFGNKGRASSSNEREDRSFSFKNDKNNRRGNEDSLQKFSLISNPDSFSSMLSQRQSGNNEFRDKNKLQVNKVTSDTRNRDSTFNSYPGNGFGDERTGNRGKEINIKFDTKVFEGNAKTITSHDSRSLFKTTLPPSRFDEVKKPHGKNSQRDIESLLNLFSINPKNKNTEGKQNQNLKFSFENTDSTNPTFRENKNRPSEIIKQNSREISSDKKNSKLFRNTDVMEFRDDRSREFQRFGNDFSREHSRKNKNQNSEEFRGDRNRDSRDSRVRGDDIHSGNSENLDSDREFRSHRNRENREPQLRDERFSDQHSSSKSKRRESQERFHDERGTNSRGKSERPRSRSKDFSNDDRGLRDDIDSSRGSSKDFDSSRFNNRENNRKNKDYDSARYRDYDDDSTDKKNRDYDSSGFRREKGSRNQDYDTSEFRKNREQDTRNSRRKKSKSKRPSNSKDQFDDYGDKNLPPLNFDSLLDSFEERDKGRSFRGKKKSKSQNVDDFLDFIHDGGKNSGDFEDFDEIVKNLNDDPNFLSNLGFTFVNASELPSLDQGNNKKGNRGNKNKDDSPLSLFETLVNLKDPKIKNDNSDINFNSNKGNKNSNLNLNEKDKNKQSLSDLLSSFKLNTNSGGRNPPRQNKQEDQNPSLQPNSKIRVGNKENNVFSTARPQSFKHVTEGSTFDGKKPFSLRPTKIPNTFASTTPDSFGITEVTSNGVSSTGGGDRNPGVIPPPFRMTGGAPVFINSTVFVASTPIPPFLSPIDYIPRLRTPIGQNNLANSKDSLPFTYHVIPGGQNLIPGINAISNKGLFGVNNPFIGARIQQPNRPPGHIPSPFPVGNRESPLPTTTPFPTTPHQSTFFPPTPRPFGVTPQPTPLSLSPFPGAPQPTSPFSVTPGHTSTSAPTHFPITLRPTSPGSNTPFAVTHQTTPFSVTPRPTFPFSATPNPTTPHPLFPQSRGAFPNNPRSSFPTTPIPLHHSTTSPFSVGSNPSTPFSVTHHPTTQFSASPYPTTFLPGTLNPTVGSQFPSSPSPVTPFPGRSPTTPFSPHSFPTSFPNNVNHGQGFSRPNALPIVTSEVPPKIILSTTQPEKQDLKSLTARGRRLRGRAREGENKGNIHSVTPKLTTVAPTTPITTEQSLTLRTVPPNFAVRRRLRKKVRRRKKKRVFDENPSYEELIDEPSVQLAPSSPYVRNRISSNPHLKTQGQEHNRILRKIPVGIGRQKENHLVHPDGIIISPHDVNQGHIIPNSFVSPTPFGPIVTTQQTRFGFPNTIAHTTFAPHLRTIAPATLERIKTTNPSLQVTALPRGKSLTASPTPFVSSTLSPLASPFERNVYQNSIVGPHPSTFPLSRLRNHPHFNSIPSSTISPHKLPLGNARLTQSADSLARKKTFSSNENLGIPKRLRGQEIPNHLSPNALNQHFPRIPLTAVPFHSTAFPQLNTPLTRPILVTSPRPAFVSTTSLPESFTASPRPKFRKATPTSVPVDGTLSREIEDIPIQHVDDVASFNSAEIPGIPKRVNLNGLPPHHLGGFPRVPFPRIPQGLGPYLSPYGPVLFDPRTQNLTHSFAHPSLGLGPAFQGLHSPASLMHGSPRSFPSHLGGPGSQALLYPNNIIPFTRGSIPGAGHPLAGSLGSVPMGGHPFARSLGSVPVGGHPGSLGLRKYYLQKPLIGE